MHTLRFASLAVLVSTLALLGAGCNPVTRVKEQATEAATEAIINSQLGDKGKIDISSGTVEFKDEKSGAVVRVGENVSLPENFPTAVPVAKDAHIIGASLSQKDEFAAYLTYTTKETYQAIADWYDTELLRAGWQRESTLSLNEQEMRQYEKDGASMSVSAASDASNSGYRATVTVVYSEPIKQQ